jgi:apolipoprotein N-acyltransferase
MEAPVRRMDIGLACVSATLLVLSFPKFDCSILAWVSLMPLLLALEAKSLGAAFFLSSVTGLLLFPGVFYWIWSVDAFSLFDFLLLAVYLSLYVSLWGVGLTWIRKRTDWSLALIAPPLWVTLEYLRAHFFFLGAPWMLLGHSQHGRPFLIQCTAWTGVYGLSFLVVLVNAAIAEVVQYRYLGAMSPVRPLGFSKRKQSGHPFPRFSLAAAGVLLIMNALYGIYLLSREIKGERITVAVVQGNIPQEQKWEKARRQAILDRYTSLTQQAAQHTPALIVWPETAVPGDVQRAPELRQQVSQVAIEAQAHLLVGSGEKARVNTQSSPPQYYNSVVFFSPEGRIEGYYRKIALLPFAEYVPLRSVVRWPTVIAETMGDFLPGDRYTLFTVRQAAFGGVICWEAIFPDLFRNFVRQGARFMVNATNEAWFGETAAPYQFLAMSVFRAAENRIALVRATNTGVSAFIDPFGRISERLQDSTRKELFIAGVLVGEIVLAQEKTFYTQYGDLFAFCQIVVCALLLVFAWVRVKRKQEEMDRS